jgi:hypothetical protein
VALWRKVPVLDTARILAEVAEEAGVAPVPIDDTANLRGLTLFLVGQGVLKAEIEVDKTDWRIERRAESALPEGLMRSENVQFRGIWK